MILIGVLFGILPLCRIITADKIRVVTWNVADNSEMGGSYTDAAIDTVLGLDKLDTDRPSIYAIGLEENCWNCNTGNLQKIGDLFLSRIEIVQKGQYSVIGIQGTRMSSLCEIGCSFKTDGTTALLVIGKQSKIASHSVFRHNEGCHKNWLKNKEKGIAAMKIILQGGKTVCFGAGHLDADSSIHRRQCLRNFFVAANEKDKWSDCDAQYIFGDFNTRTGNKGGGQSKEGKHMEPTGHYTSLREKDELAGSKPYGADTEWKGNLLDYINTIYHVNAKDQIMMFQECDFNFMPTYSILPARKYCNDEFPCYRKNRPKSWTDRILYYGSECLIYDVIDEEYGDHFPVFAEYTLDFYGNNLLLNITNPSKINK